MNKNFKIYKTPIVLFWQVLMTLIFSDALFFVMLKLVDFAHRDSVLVSVLTAKEELVVAVMIFQMLAIVYAFLNWIFNYYWFDGNLLFHRKGIIFTSVREFIIPEVEVAIKKQGIWGKIFNFATIQLIFSNSKVRLGYIPNPDSFIRIINNRKLEKSEKKK